jgi:hypothetical protein
MDVTDISGELLSADLVGGNKPPHPPRVGSSFMGRGPSGTLFLFFVLFLYF